MYELYSKFHRQKAVKKEKEKEKKEKTFPSFSMPPFVKAVKFLYFIYIYFLLLLFVFFVFSPTELTARRSIDLWSTLCFLLPPRPRSSTNHCVTHIHDWPKSRDNLNQSKIYIDLYSHSRYDTIASKYEIYRWLWFGDHTKVDIRISEFMAYNFKKKKL